MLAAQAGKRSMSWLTLSLFGVLLLIGPANTVFQLFVPNSGQARSIIYGLGDYIVPAALIWMEIRSLRSERLSSLHLDRTAMILFLAAPVLRHILELALHASVPSFRVPTLEWGSYTLIAVSIVLLAGIVWRRVTLEAQPGLWKWIILSVVLSCIMPLVLKTLFRWPLLAAGVPVSTYLDGFIVSLTRNAVWEEVSMRGVAWGLFRRLGLKDVGCLVLTTVLWWIPHAWQLTPTHWAPLIFFVFIPLMGLVNGFLTWRSRSVFPAMIAHALMNTFMM